MEDGAAPPGAAPPGGRVAAADPGLEDLMPPPTRPCRRGAWLALAVAVALAARAGPPPARADRVILKDGTVLPGRVKQETKAEFDAMTHEAFQMAAGLCLIDDGRRRI